MVQLKAQDLEHRNSMKGLRDQVRGSVSHQSALSISHNDDSCALGGRQVLGKALKRRLRVPLEHPF